MVFNVIFAFIFSIYVGLMIDMALIDSNSMIIIGLNFDASSDDFGLWYDPIKIVKLFIRTYMCFYILLARNIWWLSS